MASNLSQQQPTEEEEKREIESIVHTFLEAVVLVTLVVFIFLQNLRATIIPLLTVPVSLIGTFIFFPCSASR
jgi:HAE1 family hydrophobic/amphiphilic exporter-1